MPSSWGQQARYGDFEIVGATEGQPHLLGKGGFGMTFEAVRRDTILDNVIEERVALKVLDPKLLTSRSKRAQILNEVRALTKLKHRNLVHYVRCGEETGEVYYAMEMCRGGALPAVIQRFGALPERIVALIGLQVSAGLREMHERHGLLHRDIKPSNIMLLDEIDSHLGVDDLANLLQRSEGLCKIVDFGLASSGAEHDDDGAPKFAGSPMFASPEQVCERELDGRTDIYSLGLTLLYLIRGQGPLVDDTGTEIKTVLEAFRRHAMPEEHELPANLSPGLRGVLAPMVAKEPQNRFASASELNEALKNFLDGVSPEIAPRKREIIPCEVTRLSTGIADAFEIPDGAQSEGRQGVYRALERATGRDVRLTIVAQAEEVSEEEMAQYENQACCRAALTQDPDAPRSILRAEAVVRASDSLACVEEYTPHVTLEQALKVKADSRRQPAFAEALFVLEPAAEALDFIWNATREPVALRGADLWLSGQDFEKHKDEFVSRAFGQWPGWEVRCSVMSFSISQRDIAPPDGTAQTLRATGEMRASVNSPAEVLARLTYRILCGREVPAAARYSPDVYAPAIALCAASNAFVRDLVSAQSNVQGAAEALQALRKYEGVVYHRPEEPSAETEIEPPQESHAEPPPDTPPAPPPPPPARAIPAGPKKKWALWASAAVFVVALAIAVGVVSRNKGEKTKSADGSGQAGSATPLPIAELLARFSPPPKMEFASVTITGKPAGMKDMEVLFSKTPITLAQYQEFVQSEPTKRSWPKPDFLQGDDHPAVNVSWNDAIDYCQWLTKKERSAGRLPASLAYRLPSDHEWSCAAGLGAQEDGRPNPKELSGKATGYPWGPAWPPPQGSGNYEESISADGYEFTSPVKAFRSNSFGLYDIGGNVWQWCNDKCDPADSSDLAYRVLRGGSWNNFAETTLLSSFRRGDRPTSRHDFTGFRCVVAPDAGG